MNKKWNLLLCACLAVGMGYAQRGVRIGYVDMEYILENVEEYREATEQLDNKVVQWKMEMEERQRRIDQMKQDLDAERVLLTDQLIAEREEEIAILEKELLDYQQNRFGPRGDLVLQKQRLIQPIQDQVFNEVQKIGANKKYDFIFDKSADVVMLYSEKRHDISDLILRGIARTRRVSSPPKSPTSQLDAFEGEEEGEEVISEALLERQQKAQQAEEARAKTAEEKREEALKLREERRKAYEARRQKLLEEREARNKAREDARKKETETKKDTIN
ncbi:OmpH family outer membrane protein [Robiginitalea marina]|uniref:OmpH family outer membrane protein n=1 Tax=Robiginitalea marina TaxID=2954105 RepID=A0ABT1AYF3_9FLAO|nr:OmpH family outer membrane protein [Robiginitalea marina]MCO5724687.1 OmpH family outer membrane protein [Robiginitalea marina]